MDVWLRGGDIQTERLRQVLIEPLRIMHAMVKDPFAAYLRAEKLLRKASFKRASPLRWAREKELRTALQFVIHVASPNASSDILTPYQDSQTMEESPTEELYKTLGVGHLSFLELPHDEHHLLELNRIMNTRRMLDAVKGASTEDLLQIRNWLAIAEEWVVTWTALRVIQPDAYRFFGLLEYVLKRRLMFRVVIATLLLILSEQADSRSAVIRTISDWDQHLPQLRVLADYIHFMKQDKTLRRHRDWNTCLRNCSEPELDELRRLHGQYCEAHPEFMDFIQQFKKAES